MIKVITQKTRCMIWQVLGFLRKPFNASSDNIYLQVDHIADQQLLQMGLSENEISTFRTHTAIWDVDLSR